jgi:hypothetical protein
MFFFRKEGRMEKRRKNEKEKEFGGKNQPVV